MHACVRAHARAVRPPHTHTHILACTRANARTHAQVANLRAENAMLRGKYQSILAEQNDVLDEKHTQHVNHLMNVKYDIEEQVEAELERFDQV
jgi:hypothetical protein